MKEWKDDKALITLIKAELYTAVIGDIPCSGRRCFAQAL